MLGRFSRVVSSVSIGLLNPAGVTASGDTVSQLSAGNPHQSVFWWSY
jgi:hypothetical protein